MTLLRCKIQPKETTIRYDLCMNHISYYYSNTTISGFYYESGKFNLLSYVLLLFCNINQDWYRIEYVYGYTKICYHTCDINADKKVRLLENAEVVLVR